jgi:hypothetical protein
MKSPRRALCVVVSILSGFLLDGCVTAPSVDADRSVTGRIGKIALLSIPQPREVPVANLGGAASAFGLVGGLIQADTNKGQADQFAEFLKTKNIDISRHFEDEIMRSLREAGYEAYLVTDQKPKVAADGKSDDYSGIHVEADAILSIWSRSFGYISPPNSTHYQPSGVVMVRLIDSKTKSDIYFKTFVVGWKLPIKESIYLETNEKYRYRSIEQFKASEDEATQGLFEAEQLISQHVEKDLGSRPKP